MRILFLSQVLPYPLDAGPKMRSYFVLRHLVKHHQVTLLTFIRDTDTPENIAHLAELCHAVHTVPMRRAPLREVTSLLKSLATQKPFLITRDDIPEMKAKIGQLLNSQAFDAIHADQLWMAQYALEGQTASPKPKLILDQHNAVYLIPQRLAEEESNPLKRMILARETGLLKSYETDVCNRFDHVVWVTEEDRRAVAALSPKATEANNNPPSTVIPICGDPSGVNPVTPTPDRRRITFLGGLHWPPNAQGIVWFAKEVFPLIRKAAPEAILTVIGKSPPPELDTEGIEVTGYVDDLMPYLAQTAAFIVPLHAGGGMRVKIIDAWSWGLPIISTTIGAEGIDISPPKDILIADSAADFAEAVLRVLNNPDLARNLGNAGRETVLEKYNWKTVYSKWEAIYGGETAGENE